jgi:cytochrome c
MKRPGLAQRNRLGTAPILLIGTLIGYAGAPVHAAGPPGGDLFKTKGCPACHGEDGSHPLTPDYPVIAGQNANYLLRQMQDIRDGRRTNGLSQNMRAVVAEVTDDQFKVIADWLATRW